MVRVEQNHRLGLCLPFFLARAFFRSTSAEPHRVFENTLHSRIVGKRTHGSPPILGDSLVSARLGLEACYARLQF